MEENGPERVIHLPYSPDLAPSGFSLFSHMKHCPRGQSFETADGLFLIIDAISMGIEKWTLHAAFSIGCMDSYNVLDSIVTILRGPNNV
jgi:hypothetical protein